MITMELKRIVMREIAEHPGGSAAADDEHHIVVSVAPPIPKTFKSRNETTAGESYFTPKIVKMYQTAE